jgi:thiol:disulfide interchange protein DsbA
VRQANSIARAAKITGTPALMVSGKYMISPRKAGSTANMLKIADYLIEKERAAKGS